MASVSVTQKLKRTTLECQICGAPAFGTHFGVTSCSSCKMFFKRNAESVAVCFDEKFVVIFFRLLYFSNSSRCEMNGYCQINVYTRRTCSACRLAKCLARGMQTELFRAPRTKKIMNESVQLPTLNLLQKDQSTLTTNQWTLLSNLTHCYDDQDGQVSASRFITEQNHLPAKSRYKLEPVGQFLQSNILRVQRILENNGDYLSLCISDRSNLLRQTVRHTGCFGGTFVLHQASLLIDPLFYKSTETIFGPEVMLTIQPINDTFDSDIVFVKLILTIIAFSTISCTVYTNTSSIDFTDLKLIIRIQDTYVELAWRYLIYKYNNEQAVKRFCGLLRCLFNVHSTIVIVNEIEQYTNMIDTIVKQTEELFINNS